MAAPIISTEAPEVKAFDVTDTTPAALAFFEHRAEAVKLWLDGLNATWHYQDSLPAFKRRELAQFVDEVIKAAAALVRCELEAGR